MGFYKEVELVPPPVPSYFAFQYDGTQQSIDDLNNALPTNSYNIYRIDSDKYHISAISMPDQIDTDAVVVFTVYLSLGSVGSPVWYATVSEYESQWQDV